MRKEIEDVHEVAKNGAVHTSTVVAPITKYRLEKLLLGTVGPLFPLK
jgi:hypothetical protein